MDKFVKAIEIIRQNNGTIRTSEAIQAGIAPKTLYNMRDQGVITRVTRGVYRLTDLPTISHPDLISVAIRYPSAVICLLSALNYYDLTDQIPHFVMIALPQGARQPQMSYPPLQVIRFSKHLFMVGINNVIIDAVPVKIYSPEKTIADCFKFRNKFGLDVAIDALKRYLEQPAEKQNIETLLHYARLNRVAKVMTPYLESLL